MGDASLNEGADFFLLTSSGISVLAKLVKGASKDAQSAHIAEGAAVLIMGASDTKALFPAITALRRQGAAVILVPETPGLSAIPRMFGGETSVSVRLAEAPAHKSTTMILIHTDAAAKLSASEGAVVALTVHEVPQGSARRSMP